MKKGFKKVRLNRETLRLLESGSLWKVAGGVTVVACASKNPTICDPNSNCQSCLDTQCGATCRVTCNPCGP